jgi:hypothetical protein
VGKPITVAPEPYAAAQKIIEEIALVNTKIACHLFSLLVVPYRHGWLAKRVEEIK